MLIRNKEKKISVKVKVKFFILIWRILVEGLKWEKFRGWWAVSLVEISCFL
jgi:hypothetical protein